VNASWPEPPRGADRAAIAAVDGNLDWRALESLIHIDPAGRGLASFVAAKPESSNRLDAGQLRAAANHLATSAAAVGIVTGFCAIANDQVTAETDGPPGALLLARVLSAAGADVCLISDAYGVPLLRAGCEVSPLPRPSIVEFPSGNAAHVEDAWIEEFFARGRGNHLTHLVAIERPGPSHTLGSIERQPHSADNVREEFLRLVPESDRDVCHDMRGESIERWTARTHRLFEWIVEQRLGVTTIGIGDGGNEIGMGRFAWETIVRAIGSEMAGKIACRVSTDYTIVGGVSDWAAYALALAFARLRGIADRHQTWNAQFQADLVKHLVERGGAIDGITRRGEATVDGLPLELYLEPLVAMRKLLSFEQ
jgi:hypothetical protein